MYPHGGYPFIHEAIAAYAGVEPENVVLGAGADDLIMLVARAYAGPGDVIAIPPAPTYPVFKVAANLAGELLRLLAVGERDVERDLLGLALRGVGEELERDRIVARERGERDREDEGEGRTAHR